MIKSISLFPALLLILAGCSHDDSVGDSCALSSLNQQLTIAAENPCAVAISASGKVAVTRYNSIDSGYGALGSVTIAASVQAFEAHEYLAVFGSYAPEAVVFDSNDNVFVSQTEQVAGIAVFQHDGNNGYAFIKTIQADFNNPRGLAVDAQNRLFMADDGTGRIIRFDDPVASNDHVTIGNWDAGIKGLAFRANVLYVTNYVSGVVSRNIPKPDGTFEIDAAADIYMATDVSVRGNVIVVTSYDDAKIYVLSDCDFSEENMRTYDNLGKCFGTAFVNETKLAGGFLQDDEVRTFSL